MGGAISPGAAIRLRPEWRLLWMLEQKTAVQKPWIFHHIPTIRQKNFDFLIYKMGVIVPTSWGLKLLIYVKVLSSIPGRILPSTPEFQPLIPAHILWKNPFSSTLGSHQLDLLWQHICYYFACCCQLPAGFGTPSVNQTASNTCYCSSCKVGV